MKTTRRTILGMLGAGTILLSQALPAAAAGEFPNKPITVVVPFAPGGYTDTVARVIAKAIEDNKLLSQPMIIVNMGGGGGAPAFEKLISSDPDGETIMLWQYNALIAEALDVGNFSIDKIRSIGFTGETSPVWAVGPKTEQKSLDAIVEQLKAEPESLVEVAGIGTIAQFAGAQLKDLAGVETRFVNVTSGADRTRMLLGGNADISLFSPAEVNNAPDLTPVVSFAAERSDHLPDVPTVAELGYPEAVWSNPMWWMAPKGTPEEAITVLSTALEKAMETPDVKTFFETNGDDPSWTPGPQATEMALAKSKDVKALAEKLK